MGMPNSQKRSIEYWQKIVITLCLGWMVIWVYRAILSPIYSDMQLTIGKHSGAAMGTIASLYFLSYTFMQIPSGVLVDKIGKKKMLIPGFILFAVATFIVGTAKTINQVYVGSFLAGLSTGAYYGAAYSLAGSVIPRKYLTLSNAVINSGTALGMALGLISSSLFVKSLNIPWYYCLYMITGLILITTIIFLVVVKPDSNVKTIESVDNNTQDVPQVRHSGLFSLRSISAYFLYFSTCYGYYVIVTWLPDFLEAERGFKGVAIGMTAALVGLAGIPGALFFSRQADKFQNKRVFIISALEFTASITLALIVLAPSSKILLIGLILYGLVGKLACDPILISFITAGSTKRKLGTALTVFNFFGMIGAMIAPAITGKISDALGSKEMGFYVSVALLFISTIFFAIVNSRANKKS